MDDTQQGIAKFKEEMRKLTKEVEVLTRSIDVKRIEFTEEVSAQLELLAEGVNSVKQETILLHAVPSKLKAQLAEITPSIASEINRLNQKQIKELSLAHTQDVANHNQAIKDAAFNLKQIKEEICKIDGMRIKRYFMGLCSVMLFSVLASLGASYALMNNFPHRVHIESPNNVAVQNSEVSMWSSKNVTTSGKEKIMKY